LRRALNWIVGVPVVALIVIFAVANRQWIEVSLDPLSREAPRAAISMPLWSLFFCGIFFGLIAGWLACWIAQKKWRRAARDARVELQRGQDELSRLKRESGGRRDLAAPGANAT
jgi:hypothetical protein